MAADRNSSTHRDALALRWRDQKLWILDQQALPNEEIWLEIHTSSEMVAAIRQLKVRGAPLIGVAACLALARDVVQGISFAEFHSDWQKLLESRPTAVNLRNCLHRLKLDLREESFRTVVLERALAIFDEDVELCQRMADHGAQIVRVGEKLLTHCNTGGLATVGCGTALGVIRHAHSMGRQIQVHVDETRPLLQGARLTAWELDKFKIPYTLNTDSMAAYLMQLQKVDRVLVGADRICRNGDFANKVGTYALAVLCRFHNIPFHCVAPMTTYDEHCQDGADIPIEQREAAEVLGFVRHNGAIRWAAPGAKVFNPSFDVTPADLVTSFITDSGVWTPAEWRQMVSDQSLSKKS